MESNAIDGGMLPKASKNRENRLSGADLVRPGPIWGKFADLSAVFSTRRVSATTGSLFVMRYQARWAFTYIFKTALMRVW